jgi:hypothetical protein
MEKQSGYNRYQSGCNENVDKHKVRRLIDAGEAMTEFEKVGACVRIVIMDVVEVRHSGDW